MSLSIKIWTVSELAKPTERHQVIVHNSGDETINIRKAQFTVNEVVYTLIDQADAISIGPNSEDNRFYCFNHLVATDKLLGTEIQLGSAYTLKLFIEQSGTTPDYSLSCPHVLGGKGHVSQIKTAEHHGVITLDPDSANIPVQYADANMVVDNTLNIEHIVQAGQLSVDSSGVLWVKAGSLIELCLLVIKHWTIKKGTGTKEIHQLMLYNQGSRSVNVGKILFVFNQYHHIYKGDPITIPAGGSTPIPVKTFDQPTGQVSNTNLLYFYATADNIPAFQTQIYHAIASDEGKGKVTRAINQFNQNGEPLSEDGIVDWTIGNHTVRVFYDNTQRVKKNTLGFNHYTSPSDLTINASGDIYVKSAKTLPLVPV